MSNPTEIGGQEPSEPPSAEPPSAETAEEEALDGTIGIYIAIRKIRPGVARFFARMRSMCGSIETYLQMRGAAFRPINLKEDQKKEQAPKSLLPA